MLICSELRFKRLRRAVEVSLSPGGVEVVWNTSPLAMYTLFGDFAC